jgi:hypothetical protein
MATVQLDEPLDEDHPADWDNDFLPAHRMLIVEAFEHSDGHVPPPKHRDDPWA